MHGRLCIVILVAVLIALPISDALADITITAIVPGLCGNGLLEPGEQCDGAELNNRTCQSFNFATGTLSCSGACSFDISQCSGLGTPGGGGGGGSNGGGSHNEITGVRFMGKAYPLSRVTLLRDGIVAITTIAGPDANFSISLNNFAGGHYIFALFAEDKEGRRSNLFSVPIYVQPGASTEVSGIYLAPTIAVDKIEVKKNDVLAIFGQSTPTSTVTIMVNSVNEVSTTTSTDNSGFYLYNLDTTLLEYGDHGVRSRASKDNNISGESPVISFKVSDLNVAAPPAFLELIGDYNKDGHVNLIDFSIGAYWYKKGGFPPEIDLNVDDQIDLVDFSILVYHWTG